MRNWIPTTWRKETRDNGELDGTSGCEGDSGDEGEHPGADSGERTGAMNSGGSAISMSSGAGAGGLVSGEDWRAWNGRGRRRACMGNGWQTWWRAGSGLGLDTLQTPEDPFPPAQSCGVWEVHGVIVVGPDPEQRFHRGCSDPAELQRKRHKRGVSAGQGRKLLGCFHSHREKQPWRKTFKNHRKQNGGKDDAYFLFGSAVVSRNAGDKGRRRRGVLQNTISFNNIYQQGIQQRNTSRQRIRGEHRTYKQGM